MYGIGVHGVWGRVLGAACIAALVGCQGLNGDVTPCEGELVVVNEDTGRVRYRPNVGACEVVEVPDRVEFLRATDVGIPSDTCAGPGVFIYEVQGLAPDELDVVPFVDQPNGRVTTEPDPEYPETLHQQGDWLVATWLETTGPGTARSNRAWSASFQWGVPGSWFNHSECADPESEHFRLE